MKRWSPSWHASGAKPLPFFPLRCAFAHGGFQPHGVLSGELVEIVMSFASLVDDPLDILMSPLRSPVFQESLPAVEITMYGGFTDNSFSPSNLFSS